MRNARVLLGVAMMGLAAMCGIAQGQERSAGHGANEIREHEQAPNAEEKSLASSEGKSGGA